MQETKWKVIELEKDHMKLELRVDSAVADIAALKSDIRVIVEWVEAQKRKSLPPTP